MEFTNFLKVVIDRWLLLKLKVGLLLIEFISNIKVSFNPKKKCFKFSHLYPQCRPTNIVNVLRIIFLVIVSTNQTLVEVW